VKTKFEVLNSRDVYQHHVFHYLVQLLPSLSKQIRCRASRARNAEEYDRLGVAAKNRSDELVEIMSHVGKLPRLYYHVIGGSIHQSSAMKDDGRHHPRLVHVVRAQTLEVCLVKCVRHMSFISCESVFMYTFFSCS
jgi:hypothetical protein